MAPHSTMIQNSPTWRSADRLGMPMRLLDSTSQLLSLPGSFRSSASGKTGSGPKLNTAKLKNTMTTSGGVLRNPST